MSEWRKKLESVADQVKGTFNDVTQNEKFVEAKSKAEKLLEDSGAIPQMQLISKVAEDGFDTISGIKQLQLVEERLALQAQYNDILAEKLQEALQRIKILEDALASK